MIDDGKLIFLLCVVLGLLGPRCKGEACSYGSPDCRGRQWCQDFAQPTLAAVLWVCLKPGLRSTGTSSNLFSLCTPHCHVLHLDSYQTGAVVQGAAQCLLQSALVTCPGEGVEGDFMDWPRGSLVAQLEYKRIQEYNTRLVSWINNRANTGAKLAKEPPLLLCRRCIY